MKALNTLSLEDSRHIADMVVVYRCLHNLCDVTLEDIDLLLLHNNEGSGKLRLHKHCLQNQNASMLFKFRVSKRLNKLSVSVTSAKNVSGFKTTSLEHFLARD